jgi:hypothetical protein
MRKFGSICVALTHMVLFVTLPSALHAESQQIELSGTWVGKGYSCEREGLSEQVEITINGNYMTAKKTTGDNCVPAGNVTFQGTLPDSIAEGQTFPVTFTVGSPSDPASGKATGEMTIVNSNSLYAVISSERITFRRISQLSRNSTNNPSSNQVGRCQDDERAFVTAETKNFFVYICGKNKPTYYIGIAKDNSGTIRLSVSSASTKKYIIKNRGVAYILTPQVLTITQNGKVLQQDPIISSQWQ